MRNASRVSASVLPTHPRLVEMGDVAIQTRQARYAWVARLAAAVARPVGVGLQTFTVGQGVRAILDSAGRTTLLFPTVPRPHR